MKELLRAFFRLTLLPPVRFIYRLRVIGAENVPARGGVLLASNHATYLDSFLLYAACPRRPRFIVVSRFLSIPGTRWFLDLFGAIAIEPGRSRDAIRAAAACLRAGEAVCIFPEGQLTRTGLMNGLKKGYELIARQGGAPVVPVYMHGLWGSIFSYERKRYFRKRPRRLPWPVAVAFGPPLPVEECSGARLQRELRDLSERAFAAMPMLESSLALSAVRALKRRRGALFLAEHGRKAPRRLRRRHFLATAAALASRWRAVLPAGEERIGVLLPSGIAPALINLALVLAGRVPVNLPFPRVPSAPLDPGAVSAALRDAGLGTVITSRAFLGPLDAVPWPRPEQPGRYLDFSAEIAAIPLGRRVGEQLLALAEPAWLACRRLGLSAAAGEAAAWAGHRDGRCRELSGRDILARALRLSSGGWIEEGEAWFAEESLASADGALWSLWLPLLHGCAVAGRSWAAREELDLVEDTCRAEKVRRLAIPPELAAALGDLPEPWHPEQRAALRSVILLLEGPNPDQTGSSEWADRVESRLGAPLCPAWGPGTPEAGVVAISQPDPNPVPLPPALQAQSGRREGSPGRLLPGIAARETAGRVQLRGPGLGEEGGWVDAGMAASLDEEGFLLFGEAPG